MMTRTAPITHHEEGHSRDQLKGYLLLAMTLVLIVLQTRSIAVFPIANATRWFSDETWVMEEAQSQIRTGVVTYPHARASSLVSAKGLLLGTPWVSSVLYGLPAALAPEGADIVVIGRTVTLCLTILAALFLFIIARRLGLSWGLSAFGPFLMIGTRASFIASHCARPDMLAGLLVLGVVGYFTLLKQQGFSPSRASWWYWFGIAIMAIAWTSSIHLLTLLGPLAIWLMYSFGAFRKGSFFLAAAGGALTTALLLAGIYTLTTAHVTAGAPHEVQFDKIIEQTPILRPFSRSVQVANILIRVKLFWSEALGVSMLIGGSFLLLMIALVKQGSLQFLSETERFLVISTCVVIISWLFFELASQTYTMHVLPIIVLTSLVLSASSLRALKVATRAEDAAIIVMATLFFYLAARDTQTALARATQLDQQSGAGIQQILDRVRTDAVAKRQKPLVVTETPFLHKLSLDTEIAVMTDHFTGFRTSSEDFITIMRKLGVRYILLYNSDHYPKNRYTDDDFFMAVAGSCDHIGTATGQLFDMSYSYFDTSQRSSDSLLLYKMPQ